MKKFVKLLLALFLLTSCASESTTKQVNSPKAVVIGSSLTDIWLLSGGEVIGTTSDAITRGLVDEDMTNVGTYNEPNVETILSLNPEIVILSSDMDKNMAIVPTLENAGIEVYAASYNSFDDYLTILEDFTTLNNNQEAYQTYGLDNQAKIDEYIDYASNLDTKDAIVMRTSSSKLSVLSNDYFTVSIITDMNLNNIASNESSVLFDLNIEAIAKSDPYYIFITTMGNDSAGAMATLDDYIKNNPSWNNLTAVKENRIIYLDQELFHYKPNERWYEAYEYIYNVRKEE